jgi:hypothetical protein
LYSNGSFPSPFSKPVHDVVAHVPVHDVVALII